jgi:acetyltransferase
MIEGDGLELIVGIKREKGLGTLIMVGMGGIYVEILKDAVFRFTPLTREDAKEMIDELKSKALLYGFRGSPKRDIDILVDVLLRISNLVTLVPQISELDINPFFLKTEGQGGMALDARMILETRF